MVIHAKGTATMWCTRHNTYDGSSVFFRTGRLLKTAGKAFDMIGFTCRKMIEKIIVMTIVSLSKFGSASIPLVILEELAGRFKNCQYALKEFHITLAIELPSIQNSPQIEAFVSCLTFQFSVDNMILALHAECSYSPTVL